MGDHLLILAEDPRDERGIAGGEDADLVGVGLDGEPGGQPSLVVPDPAEFRGLPPRRDLAGLRVDRSILDLGAVDPLAGHGVADDPRDRQRGVEGERVVGVDRDLLIEVPEVGRVVDVDGQLVGGGVVPAFPAGLGRHTHLEHGPQPALGSGVLGRYHLDAVAQVAEEAERLRGGESFHQAHQHFPARLAELDQRRDEPLRPPLGPRRVAVLVARQR